MRIFALSINAYTKQMETKTLSHLLKLATAAHSGTSFSPEKRGQRIVDDYSAELDSDLNSIREAAAKNSEVDAEALGAALARYQNKYEHYLRAYLHSHSNIVSTMIAGPSNFPVRQMEKRNRWADNHYKAFRTFRERALKAIIKSFEPSKNELEEARKTLARLISRQEMMKKANKAIRANKDNREAQVKALTELGLGASNIDYLLTPDWWGLGFAPFSLTNNNNKIKRWADRVKLLEAKQHNAETKGNTTTTHNGVEVIYNREIDRLQLIYPGKPDTDTITKLKKNGFRWSPSNKAWQRQLTNNAVTGARKVLGIEN